MSCLLTCRDCARMNYISFTFVKKKKKYDLESFLNHTKDKGSSSLFYQFRSPSYKVIT